jgi:hypothetical protein
MTGRVRRVVAKGWRKLRRAESREFAAGIETRKAQCAHPVEPGEFSLLTTVYEGTSADLFDETVRSVLEQTSGLFEWVILAHGPISDQLERRLVELHTDTRVRVLREPKNLGIVGGMRRCLEEAAGVYVVPLDADDLLAEDALQWLAHVVAERGRPAFVYSDEAIRAGSRPRALFRRPAFDRLLNLECSYVWHLCAFRRDRALSLDVYGDPGCEFCHDWDTISRFADAGETPVHTPELLYQWRRHEGSQTHRAGPKAGSLASQFHLLQRRIDARPRPELYRTADFPISRGVVEPWIERRRLEPGSMTLVHLMPPFGPKDTWGRHLLRVVSEADYPFQSILLVGGAGELGEERERIEAKLTEIGARHGRQSAGPRVRSLTTGSDFAGFLRHDFDSDYVAVCSAGYLPTGDGWAWEAVKLFEFLPDMGLIAGRLVDSDGCVHSGGALFGADGQPEVPGRGSPATEPGPFGMFLKPRMVDLVDDRFWIGRAALLEQGLVRPKSSETIALIDGVPRGDGAANTASPGPTTTSAPPKVWPIASEHHIVAAIVREVAGSQAFTVGSSPLISARWTV